MAICKNKNTSKKQKHDNIYWSNIDKNQRFEQIQLSKRPCLMVVVSSGPWGTPSQSLDW
jgi:hypothetical protein